MIRFVAFLLGAALAQLAVAAPASEASVLRLMALTNAAAMVDTMYAGVEQVMRQGMQQAVAGRPLTPEQQKLLEVAPARMSAVLRTELSWDNLKPDYVAIYQQTFDQSEIDALIAFYETPAGQALIAKMPLVVQRSIAVSQARMQQYLPKIRQAIDDAMREAGIAK